MGADTILVGAIVVGIIAMANPNHGSTTKKPEKKAAVSGPRAE